MTTRELREVGSEIISRGRVTTDDLERLRAVLYENGRIGRLAVDTLIDIHRRLERPSGPAFRQFLNRAVKDHVLKDGKVAAEEAAWLREMLFHDGKIADEERTLIRELHGEAKDRSSEFEALFAEVCKEPVERHTSGGGRDAEQDRRK